MLRCRPPKCAWRRTAAAAAAARASLSTDSPTSDGGGGELPKPQAQAQACARAGGGTGTGNFEPPAPHVAPDETDISAQLLACAAYVGPVALNKVAAALELCQTANSDDDVARRNVGVAHVCAELKMDCETLCAAVLRGYPNDTTLEKTRIEQAVGGNVVEMLDVYERLEEVSRDARAVCAEDELAPFRCAMLQSSADEPRALSLRLAAALYASRIDQLGAPEALYLYAPLAGRAALWAVQSELEERAFSVVHPSAYQRTRKLMAARLHAPSALLASAREALEAALPRDGGVRAAVARARVAGRVKSAYSVYRKMRRGKRLDDIYDLLALRVIVTPRGAEEKDEHAACYAVANAIRLGYTLVERREKDYVANPKPNGYQALHLTVMVGESSFVAAPLEVQIRTEKMHHVAEFGSAAPPLCSPRSTRL